MYTKTLEDVTDSTAATVTDTVRDSFRTSYALSPLTIDAIVDEEFGREALAEKADADEVVVLLAAAESAAASAEESDAQDGGDVIGVGEGRLTGNAVGEITWLHVDPTERGEGVGSELLAGLESALSDAGAVQYSLRVLADNHEGQSFAKYAGFDRSGRGRIRVAGTDLGELLYERGPESVDDDPRDGRPASTTPFQG